MVGANEEKIIYLKETDEIKVAIAVSRYKNFRGARAEIVKLNRHEISFSPPIDGNARWGKNDTTNTPPLEKGKNNSPFERILIIILPL